MLTKVMHALMNMHLVPNDRLASNMKPGGNVSTSLFEDAEADEDANAVSNRYLAGGQVCNR